MRRFLVLWRRELAGYFLTPSVYIVAMCFLALIGFSFWTLTGLLVRGVTATAVLRELFGSIFFWIALLLVAPALTMRLFAEERRSGTFETLMTTPVRPVEAVLAKYAGALTYYAFLWLPPCSYGLVLRLVSPSEMPLDPGALAAGYLGAMLVGAFFLAVGLLASALTRNQLVAAVMTFALLVSFFSAGFLPFVSFNESVQQIGPYVSAVQHMLDFSRGAVDSRPVVFYVINTAWFLFAAVRVVEGRR